MAAWEAFVLEVMAAMSLTMVTAVATKFLARMPIPTAFVDPKGPHQGRW